MESQQQLADWVGTAVASLARDVTQSRQIVRDAAGRLGHTFDALAAHEAVAAHLEPVMEALQFEDLVAQLLDGVLTKLDVVSRLCDALARDPSDPAVAELRNIADGLNEQRKVCAHAIHAGEIDLF